VSRASGSGTILACISSIFGLLLTAAPALASAEPPRGDPAARLLPSEHASDTWDLTVELDGGYWVVAQATISKLGPGDRTGAVVGHVLGPDGRSHEFHKVRRDGAWHLSADRRRLDLGPIVFDQSVRPVRFHVDKKRVDLDLEIDLGAARAWSEAFTGPEYGFDLLALGAPVHGTLQLRGDALLEVSGRATLTHRWMNGLEASLVRRRVELFGFHGAAGLYFSEVTTPSGEPRRWLVVGRDGRMAEAGQGIEARFHPEGSGPPTAAAPARLEIAAGTDSGRVDLGRIVLRDEPLSRAPWFARWWLTRLTRPRFVWSQAAFDFNVRDPAGSGNLRLAGRGLVEVGRFDARAGVPADSWGER